MKDQFIPIMRVGAELVSNIPYGFVSGLKLDCH